MRFLCINPYVYDFAYYDLYAKPYGLLMLATALKDEGHYVDFIDIISVDNYLDGIKLKKKKDGTGEFYKEEIKKEEPYKNFNRKYFRFGLPLQTFLKLLNDIEKPDVILITSIMTYWYPGIRDTIKILREVFYDVPIYLGGIYAKLMPDHAMRICKPDKVIDTSEFVFLKERSLVNLFPDLKSFYKKLNYIPLLTSLGCPFKCDYCSSKKIFPNYYPFDIEKAYNYILENMDFFKVDKISFIDDALLFNKEKHIYLLLEKIIKENLKVNFYTPNGLHVKYIDERCAELLFNSGFKKLRLSLEFVSDEISKRYGNKTSLLEFKRAVKFLHKAGFIQENIGVYLLCGIRGQKWEDLKYAIDYVYNTGASPYLSEYSPVPGSKFFEEDKKYSKYDLSEPLYHNNLILPMESERFTYKDFLSLKAYNREKRVLNNSKEVVRENSLVN